MSEQRITSLMIEMKRQAAHARCRIRRWKLTEEQAFKLVDETGWLDSWESPFDKVNKMRRGEVRMLGAQVMVKP